MIDQKEIILMTKLALHEKKYGKTDKQINSYFKWDYIYINNWYTRLAVGVAVLIIVFWMVFTDVYIGGILPIIDVKLSSYLSRYMVFAMIAIILYTGISTLIYNKRYEETQKRFREYEVMLKELDLYQISKESEEEDLHDANG